MPFVVSDCAVSPSDKITTPFCVLDCEMHIWIWVLIAFIRILARRRGRRRKSCRVNGNRNGVIYDLRESPQADDVRASDVLEQQHYLLERMLPPLSLCGSAGVAWISRQRTWIHSYKTDPVDISRRTQIQSASRPSPRTS